MRRVTIGSIAVLLMLGWLSAPASAAAPVTCEGHPATMVGTEGADHLVGTAARGEVIVALGGNDLIDGDLSADTVCAGSGDDTVTSNAGLVALGEAGADHLTVGPSTDFTDVARLEGGDGNDVLENLGAVQMFITGGPGDDRMIGGPSAFTDFVPGPGSDYVEGGPSGGTVHYDDATAPVTVSLRGGYALDSGRDTLVQIRAFDGSRFNDLLIGDDNANDINCCFFGEIGIDRIYGLGGNDRLRGQGALYGGDGDDTFRGDTGGPPADDTVFGGPGIDTLDYGYTGDGVSVDLSAGTAVGPGIGTDAIASIENVVGSKARDTLTGDANANKFDGRGGADTISGGAGDDVLSGLGGDDLLDGGPGFDKLIGGRDQDTCTTGEKLTSCEF